MGGILLFAAALAAFGIGAGGVTLYVAFRRTERHRFALVNAHARIAQLERQMAALTFGEAAPAQPAVTTDAVAAQEAIIAVPAAAEQIETQPAPEPAAQPDAVVVPIGPHVPPPLAPHFPPRAPAPVETPAPIAAEPQVAAARAPMRVDAFVAVAALVSAAALLSVRLGLAPPLVGVALAAFAGAGLLLLAEQRRHTGPHADWIALFGLSAIALALTVGRTSETAAPPLAYMLGAGALAFCALILSVWYGRTLLAFGLLVGLAAPAFALGHADTPAALGLTFVLALSAIVRARMIGEPVWAWIAFAGALAWGAHAIARGGGVLHLASAAGFAASMFVLALAYGWASATAVQTPAWRREGLVTAHAAMAPALAGLLALVLLGGAFAAIGAIGLLVVALAIGCAAIARASYTPAALAVAGISALAIAFWPVSDAFDWRATGAAGLATGAIFLFCGAAIAMRGVWAGAALAALAPIALLVAAQARMANEVSPSLWALGAAAFAIICASLFTAARRQSPHAGSFAATGAALASVCAIGFLTPAPWPPVIVALALPALAALNTRWHEPGLRGAGVILAAFLALQIGALSLSDASPAARGVVYIIAAACAYAASRIYYSERPRSLSGDLTFACALLSFIVALSGEGRRTFALAPENFRLFEAGYQSALWITLALVLAHRFGAAPRWQLRALEGGVFAAAAAVALAAGGVLLNPWWGAAPAPATGWTGFNALIAAYFAPALLFAGYALLRQQHGWRLRAALSISLAALLALTNAVLEIRRAFHGPAMSAGGVTPNEGLAFAIAGAALLVAIGGALMIYRRAALPAAAMPAKTVRPAASAASAPAPTRPRQEQPQTSATAT